MPGLHFPVLVFCIYVTIDDMKEDLADSPPSSTASRPYRSPLRQKQAAATRELILRALAEQLALSGLEEFSINDAAARAGVSARTIYRYFPNREAILEAVGTWVDDQLGDLPYPTTPAEVAHLAELVFPRFEENAALIEALLQSELGQTVRSRLRAKRRQAIDQALMAVPQNQAMTPAKRALIGHLVTAETWRHLRDEFGIGGDESGEAVAWAVRALVAALGEE